MKIERYHWFYYFGGIALILLILQYLTGIFLTLFYQPHLLEAYASVQILYNDFGIGAWFRDAHRWIAFFIGSAIVMHVIRSLLRKEFMNHNNRTIWLTGSLLLLPIMALFVTGFILPWTEIFEMSGIFQERVSRAHRGPQRGSTASTKKTREWFLTSLLREAGRCRLSWSRRLESQTSRRSTRPRSEGTIPLPGRSILRFRLPGETSLARFVSGQRSCYYGRSAQQKWTRACKSAE